MKNILNVHLEGRLIGLGYFCSGNYELHYFVDGRDGMKRGRGNKELLCFSLHLPVINSRSKLYDQYTKVGHRAFICYPKIDKIMYKFKTIAPSML